MNSSTAQNTIGAHTQWHRRVPEPSSTLPHSHVHRGGLEASTHGTVARQKTTIAAATSTSPTLEQCAFQGHSNYTLSTASYQLSRLQNTLPKLHKSSSVAWNISPYHYESASSTQRSRQFENSREHHHRTQTLQHYRGTPQRVPASFTRRLQQIQRHQTLHVQHHAYINDTRATTLHPLSPHPRPPRYPGHHHCLQLHLR